MERETKLGNPALRRRWHETGDPRSEADAGVVEGRQRVGREIVRGVPPFPFVRETRKAEPRADMLVVSATPHEALEREWEEHELARYVAAICGQEIGTKKESLAHAAKYPPDHTLMIGDAPGRLQGGRWPTTPCSFPINPGAEEASWRRLFEEGIDRFLRRHVCRRRIRTELLAEFDRYLPERPPWPVEDEG